MFTAHTLFLVILMNFFVTLLTSDVADNETNDYNPGDGIGTIPQVGHREQGRHVQSTDTHTTL